MEFDVFLSYSRRDSDIFGRVRDDLRAAGLRVWTDESLTPGTPDWAREIERAIKARCRTLVVLCSPASYESEWVRRELALADAEHKPIFPLWIAGEDASDAIPLQLLTTQYLDARAGRYGDALTALVDALRQADVPRQPTAQKPVTFHPPTTTEASKTMQRRLEAAMPKQAKRGANSEVWVKISLPKSRGLRGELPAEVESGEVIERSDVRGSAFPFAFPLDARTGLPLAGRCCVEALSDEFEAQVVSGKSDLCGGAQAELEIAPEFDSRTVIFKLLPKRVFAGRARVQIVVYHQDKVIAQTSVSTEVVEAVQQPAWVLAALTLPLMLGGTTGAARQSVAGELPAPAEAEKRARKERKEDERLSPGDERGTGEASLDLDDALEQSDAPGKPAPAAPPQARPSTPPITPPATSATFVEVELGPRKSLPLSSAFTAAVVLIFVLMALACVVFVILPLLQGTSQNSAPPPTVSPTATPTLSATSAAAATAAPADLVVVSFTGQQNLTFADDDEGVAVTYTALITNLGGTATGDFVARLVIQPEERTLDFNIASLGPGEAVSLPLDVWLPQPGTYTLTLDVDYRRDVAESSEVNNVATLYLSAAAAPEDDGSANMP
ncbi:MAG: TIR domain-containing protein [Chloroflexi bacterium]|nr:TIR domain-containing protein [Chloroflexota bacterium]